MLVSDLQKGIISSLRNYYSSCGIASKEQLKTTHLKLATFEKKLAILSLEELQIIEKKIKILMNSNPNEFNLQNDFKLLKKQIKDNPKHDYQYLIPAIDFFSLGSDAKITQMIARARNLILNDDIKGSKDICNSIEKTLLFLEEIGFISLIQTSTQVDYGILSLVLILFTLLEAEAVFILWIFLSPPVVCTLGIFGWVDFVFSMFFLSIVCFAALFLIYYGLKLSYDAIHFYITVSNLQECLEHIHLSKKVSEWALLQFDKLNKLPTELTGHIAGFFVNSEKIQERLLQENQKKSPQLSA